MDELLRAVIQAPDDDAPRLVYADALMRVGDPRGEFIAMQLAGKTAESEALLAAHKDAWLAALPFVEDVHFQRGFAGWIKLRCDELAGDALAALDKEPIRDVVLVAGDADEDPVAVARWIAADPRTTRIRTLDLSHMAFERPGLDILLGADLRNLRVLYVGDGDCQTYAIDPIANLSLTTLGFYGDYYADLDEGIERLAVSSGFEALEELALPNCGLGPRAGIALARANLPRLRELEFSGGSYQANRLYDNGAIALTRPSALPALTRLSLANNEVTDDFLDELCKPYALPKLTSLAVNSCERITSRGITALAASPRFATFEELWLGGCRIDDEGIAALARAPSKLRGMNLHGNPFGVAGARALADSPLATQLEHLSVKLTPEMEAILRPAFGERLNRKA